ncbi:hypothetical protein BT93_E0285 [Corymbia citriodora subsp. variegata]|nr:hypothetical protein BT93_E0285 [Corymbia citriodora subsp. variegata]
MEGGTKVEITETKREAARGKPRPRSASAAPNPNCHVNNSKHGAIARRGKKFDWAKSLRSGGGPGIASEKGGRDDSRKSKTRSCDRRIARSNPRGEGCRSSVVVDGGGGGLARHKVSQRIDHKLLDMEMGWQS